jgi:hypothetical protein
MRFRSHLAAFRSLTLVAFMAACSAPSPSPALPDSAPPDLAPPDSANDASEDSIRFTMRVDVAPGREVHRCQFVRMPKAPDGGEIFVGARAHRYTPGSHHYLVFRTSLKTIPEALSGQVDCFEGDGIMQYARGYIAGGQTPEGADVLPEGVGLPFESEEILLFQAHYLNASAAPLEATIDLTWTKVPRQSVVHRAGVTNFYDPFIYVPPKTSALARMRCPIPKDVTIVSAVPHMHRRGKGYRAFLDAPGAAPSAAPFYTTADWEHPVPFAGPLAVSAGSHVRFECEYQNDEDRVFIQGQSADRDEMCMFTAVYYPAMGLEADQCRPGMDSHGSGTLSCSALGECMASCPAEDRPGSEFPPKIGPCIQKCFVDSCPSASGPFLAQLACLNRQCGEACKGGSGSDACRSCMIEKCPSEVTACLAAKCE